MEQVFPVHACMLWTRADLIMLLIRSTNLTGNTAPQFADNAKSPMQMMYWYLWLSKEDDFLLGNDACIDTCGFPI
jgi:hypothetical protein